MEMCRVVYGYMKLKDNFTTMIQCAPIQVVVEKHVEGLGFQMINRTKKDCVVKLKSKSDLKIQLSLAYYSLGLSSVFVLESCFARIFKHHFVTKQSKEPFKLQDVYRKGLELADLFVNEHVVDYTFEFEKFQNRVHFLSEKKLIEYDQENDWITVGKNEVKWQVLDGFD